MSGHSKWSSIKHQKGVADAKRGKLFTKLGHAVTVAARTGGGDPTMNPRLALAIEMAKKGNMPRENIERAVKRGTGELGGTQSEEVTYEGYGPGGTAIYVEAITDNRNRTTSDVRATFTKHGSKLGESGSVAYLFRQRGVLTIDKGEKDNETVELAIIDSGASDYEVTSDIYEVYTPPGEIQAVKEALERSGMVIKSAEIRYEPNQTIEIRDEKTAGQILRLMEALEELDDVSEVVSNFDIDEGLLVSLSQLT